MIVATTVDGGGVATGIGSRVEVGNEVRNFVVI